MESGISGRGLGFSYLSWIKKQADRLGLKGVAFFKHDGSIKVIAEGEEENLIKLGKKLEKGRIFSLVESFYFEWKEPDVGFQDFSINYQN